MRILSLSMPLMLPRQDVSPSYAYDLYAQYFSTNQKTFPSNGDTSLADFISERRKLDKASREPDDELLKEVILCNATPCMLWNSLQTISVRSFVSSSWSGARCWKFFVILCALVRQIGIMTINSPPSLNP